jgi:hypothetical protein
MADTHFVWYDSKGRKHIAPITPFLVPDGVTLGPPHSWLRDRNENRSAVPLETADQARRPEMAQPQTE